MTGEIGYKKAATLQNVPQTTLEQTKESLSDERKQCFLVFITERSKIQGEDVVAAIALAKPIIAIKENDTERHDLIQLHEPL